MMISTYSLYILCRGYVIEGLPPPHLSENLVFFFFLRLFVQRVVRIFSLNFWKKKMPRFLSRVVKRKEGGI